MVSKTTTTSPHESSPSIPSIASPPRLLYYSRCRDALHPPPLLHLSRLIGAGRHPLSAPAAGSPRGDDDDGARLRDGGGAASGRGAHGRLEQDDAPPHRQARRQGNLLATGTARRLVVYYYIFVGNLSIYLSIYLGIEAVYKYSFI